MISQVSWRYLDVVIHSSVSGQFLRLLCHVGSGLTEETHVFLSAESRCCCCLRLLPPPGCWGQRTSCELTEGDPAPQSHDPAPQNTQTGPQETADRQESSSTCRAELLLRMRIQVRSSAFSGFVCLFVCFAGCLRLQNTRRHHTWRKRGLHREPQFWRMI